MSPQRSPGTPRSQSNGAAPPAEAMNGKEPLSRYAQLGNGIQVEQTHGKWIDMLVEDKRASVPDQVAAKLDVGAWFATLTRKMKQIAKDLAFGCSTSEVAEKHGVTPGRISQLRRTLEESWVAFPAGADIGSGSVTNFAKC